MKSLQLTTIRLDGGTQCRAMLDAEHVSEIAEAWAAGAKIPPVVVLHDGTNYWLADGFHRYHAAEKCGFKDIPADVLSGTRLDAVKYALGANTAHGLRRTNADKRRAVEIALREFPDLSSRELAKVCAVGDQLVNRLRQEIQLRESRSCARIGADGRTRKLPNRESKIGIEIAPAVATKITAADLKTAATTRAPERAATSRSNVSGWTFQYVEMAIAHLEKISRSDPQRHEAFDRVRAWLNENE